MSKNKREGCRYIDEKACDWYYLDDKQIPSLFYRSPREVDIYENAKKDQDCGLCCHVECKDNGIIRQKSNSDAKNCLCNKHYGKCSDIVSKYKDYGIKKGDILSHIEDIDDLVRDYVIIMNLHSKTIDEKTCEKALKILEEMNQKYQNENIVNLGYEINQREQYINACIDDNPIKICKGSSSHKHHLNYLISILKRTQFMSERIVEQRIKIKQKLFLIRNPKSPKKLPSPKKSPKKIKIKIKGTKLKL